MKPTTTFDPSVLVVTHFYPPHVGGIEQVASREVAGLRRRGWRVRVLTSSAGRPGADDPDVRAVAASARLERSGVPYPLFAPSLLWHAGGLVRRSGVVHVHDALYLSSVSAALWARLLGRPLVVTQHVGVVDHPSRAVLAIQRLAYRSIGWLVWSGAERIFYVNDNVRSFVAAHGVPDDRLVALPNGVDLGTFRPPADDAERRAARAELGLPADGHLVAFVGRLVPKKGFDRLMAAAAGSSWTAVLVGEGTVAHRPNVIHLGALPHKAISLLYQACDLFALPSVGEGFPLTVQEAMASGLPVVTSDDPGYRMYGLDRRGVALIDPDGSTLRQVIDELLADDDRRAFMATYSRQLAETAFSWDRHVTELLGHYQVISSERSQSGPARG